MPPDKQGTLHGEFQSQKKRTGTDGAATRHAKKARSSKPGDTNADGEQLGGNQVARSQCSNDSELESDEAEPFLDRIHGQVRSAFQPPSTSPGTHTDL